MASSLWACRVSLAYFWRSSIFFLRTRASSICGWQEERAHPLLLQEALHTLLEPGQEGVPGTEAIEEPKPRGISPSPTLPHRKCGNTVCQYPLKQTRACLLGSPHPVVSIATSVVGVRVALMDRKAEANPLPHSMQSPLEVRPLALEKPHRQGQLPPLCPTSCWDGTGTWAMNFCCPSSPPFSWLPSSSDYKQNPQIVSEREPIKHRPVSLQNWTSVQLLTRKKQKERGSSRLRKT